MLENKIKEEVNKKYGHNFFLTINWEQKWSSFTSSERVSLEEIATVGDGYDFSSFESISSLFLKKDKKVVIEEGDDDVIHFQHLSFLLLWTSSLFFSFFLFTIYYY